MALQRDASTPARVQNTGGDSITTASFTAPPNSTLVAFANHDTASGNTTNTSSVSDSVGLTWTIEGTRSKTVQGGSAQNGHAQISSAYFPAGGSITVTTTGVNCAGACNLQLVVFTGGKSTGARCVAATASATTTVSMTVNTTADGSWCWITVTDWNNKAVPTPGAAQTLESGGLVGTHITAACWSTTTTTALSGTSVTLDDGAGVASSVNNFVLVEILAEPAAASIPPPPPRYAIVRDYGEAQWLQRDRRDALTVAAAADPLPSPLDSAWQAGGRYWHLYADAADAAPRVWQPQQRTYLDPSLLTPAAALPAGPGVRTVQVRDYGEAQWMQPPRRDPTLLGTAQLENELLGGAETITRVTSPVTNAPRWWMPQQPPREAYTPGLLDTAELEGPLLAGDLRRHNFAAVYVDRREMPQQRVYLSDPSFYPTVAPTDPLTLAWGSGGTYWLIYNTAALQVDRRESPQQRRYQSDPGLLDTALLEGVLLGGGREGNLAAYTDRRATILPRPSFDLGLLTVTDVDPTTLAAGVGGDMWRRANISVYLDRRESPAQPQRRTLYFDAGPGSPPLTLAWGAGGSLWHLYNPRRTARTQWPTAVVYTVFSDCTCTTTRPFTGVTSRGGGGTTTRPSSGITERPCSCH